MEASFTNDFRVMTGRIQVPNSFRVIPGKHWRKKRPFWYTKPVGVGSTHVPKLGSKTYGDGQESLKLGLYRPAIYFDCGRLLKASRRTVKK